ncbi:hypothetical protein NUW54_g12992 [Trametes sanguinea]|uniref:Uncharacterized protein n=1 Tax=Trametes sanguinea TaxID=158606 RepID=A0ACC1MRL7_9APHY|nr:hypothetical protein NUW54_g12992 [Trametes sanguinea]
MIIAAHCILLSSGQHCPKPSTVAATLALLGHYRRRTRAHAALSTMYQHNPVTSPRAMTLPDVSTQCDTGQNCIAPVPGRRRLTCTSCILSPFEALTSGSTFLIQGPSLLALRSGHLISRSPAQCSPQSEGSNRDYHARWRKLDL